MSLMHREELSSHRREKEPALLGPITALAAALTRHQTRWPHGFRSGQTEELLPCEEKKTACVKPSRQAGLSIVITSLQSSSLNSTMEARDAGVFTGN